MARLDIKPLTIDEIKEAFPDEIRDINPRLIAELEEDIKDCQASYNIRFNKALNYFPIDYAKKLAEEEMPKDKINQLNNLKLLLEKESRSKKPISELEITNAKNVDIRKLHEWEKPRAYSARFMACCPFHKDNTPSFMVNSQRNTFKCFSCQSYGSSIDFVMKLHNMDFVDAVKFLNKVR